MSLNYHEIQQQKDWNIFQYFGPFCFQSKPIFMRVHVGFISKIMNMHVNDQVVFLRTFVAFHQLKFLYIFYWRFAPLHHLQC